MMSANIRRLVLDPAPVLQNLIGLVLWLVVGFMAAVWMSGHSIANLSMVFAASGVILSFIVKMRIWETLPVSRAELGRAQWWCLWGRPYILITLVTAAAALIDAVFGWLRVGGLDVAAFLGGELALLGLMAVMPPLMALLGRPFGTTGGLLGFGIPLGVAMVLGFHWTVNAKLAPVRSEMLWGGAVALGAALLAYPLSPWIPLAQPKFPGHRARSKPEADSVRPARAGMAGGGALFILFFQRQARMLPVLAIAVAGLAWLARSEVLPDIVPFDQLLLIVPMFGAIGVIILAAVISQRLLAGLPLSAMARTAALQGISPAFQAILFALTLAAEVFARSGTPSKEWLVDLILAGLGGMAFSALAGPATLRFGRTAPALLVAFLVVPMAMVTGVFVAMAIHPAVLYWLPTRTMALVLAGALVALLVTGWIWTYAELAYGRAAYRQWTGVPVSWRGN